MASPALTFDDDRAARQHCAMEVTVFDVSSVVQVWQEWVTKLVEARFLAGTFCAAVAWTTSHLTGRARSAVAKFVNKVDTSHERTQFILFFSANHNV